MTATQLQIRRGTASQIAAMTPAAGEVVFNTTNNRLHLGDGATAGGIPLPNVFDLQQSAFTYLVAGGTANAITVTMTPDPGSPGAGEEILIKISSANTGAVTINRNGHGAVGAKKKSGGALADFASGDLIPNTLCLFKHDGSYYELMSTIGATTTAGVSQGGINTALGSISGSLSNPTGSGTGPFNYTTGNLSTLIGTLPGGEYAFGLEAKRSTSTGGFFVAVGGSTTSYLRQAYGTSLGGAITATVQERYITSSPPFDMGDGQCAGFIYARVNRAGEVVGLYVSEVPPWAYNGPTSIRADYICHVTGRKFRRVMRKRSLEEVIGGAEIHYDLEHITHAIKNADMGLIPHPFQGLEHPDEKIVLLNPQDDRLARLMEHHGNGGDEDVINALLTGKIYPDMSKFLAMKGPPGVPIAPLCFKYSR